MSYARCMLLISVALLCAAALVSCEKAPPPPPPVVEPPPPSPEQIFQEIRQSYQAVPALPPGLPPPPDVTSAVMGGLNAAKAKHNVTENGRVAIGMAVSEMKGMLTTAEQTEQWYLVVLWCDALTVFEPGIARYENLKEKAQIQINRPRVKVKGFFKDETSQETRVFLDIFLPETNQTVSGDFREGQEFHGLKLIGIIGDQRGVRLEYLRTGDEWEEPFRP